MVYRNITADEMVVGVVYSIPYGKYGYRLIRKDKKGKVQTFTPRNYPYSKTPKCGVVMVRD